MAAFVSFNELARHIGHSIITRGITDENVLVDVEVYCETCDTVLYSEKDYYSGSKVAANRAIRLSSMTYPQWEEQYTADNPESELSGGEKVDLYNQYIKDRQDAASRAVWEPSRGVQTTPVDSWSTEPEGWDAPAEEETLPEGAMTFDEWRDDLYSEVDHECGCGDCQDCMVLAYEGGELEELYGDYLRGFTPAQLAS